MNKPTFESPEWPPESLWPLDKIIPYPKNARTHPAEQIKLLAEHLRRWGPDQPIVVDDEGVILKGHGRLMAALEAGLAEFPVVQRNGLPEAEKKAVRLADNQVTLLSGYDKLLLGEELSELKLGDFDMPLLAFSEAQLQMYGAGPVANNAEDAPEPPKIPVSRLGDLWTLGEHRLLCGDCTNTDDVSSLLDGAEPIIMVTDPPYGVDYDPDWRNRADRANGKPYGAAAVGLVKNDERFDWRAAWKLFQGDIVYTWHPAGAMSVAHYGALVAAGFEVRMQIVWAKQQFPIGRGDYHVQHEPCWYAVRKGKTGHWQGDRTQSTLWQIDKPIKSETGHSTQKPIECMRRPIQNNSKVGDAVYDPFVGSGTTIIAAEMMKRRCLALEIEPAYVDVCVLRWQTFTGKSATLEDGRSFDTVAKERAKKEGGHTPPAKKTAPTTRPKRRNSGSAG